MADYHVVSMGGYRSVPLRTSPRTMKHFLGSSNKTLYKESATPGLIYIQVAMLHLRAVPQAHASVPRLVPAS